MPRPLTDEVRRRAGGEYVELTDGTTHFRLEGPEDGVPLLMLHGATVPLWEFELLAPLLTAAGFRVLRFDFYGHGFSDRPRIPHTIELFARQTLDLLNAVGFPRRAAVLGHSVGAVVAAALTAERPERVDRLVLMAPMLDFSATSRWSAWLDVPVLGELLMRFVAVPLLMRRRRIRYAEMGYPQLTARFREQISYAGFWQALLSMHRTQTLGDQRRRYRALGESGRDVLIVWGSLDRVTPRADIAAVRSLLPGHRYLEVAGAQHSVPLTHSPAVAAAIGEFALRTPSSPGRPRPRR